MIITTLLFGGWTITLTLLAYNGIFADLSHLPPRPVIAMFIPLPIILAFALSKTGTAIIRQIPAYWLVYLQSFRVFVEILLWQAFLNAKLPVQMTFEGGNFDILTGIVSLPAGYFIAKNKHSSQKISLAFNIVGIVLLLNILVIALLSMPTPLRYFMNEPANVIVGEIPYIFLPGVLVPVAYGLHILSLRKWYLEKKAVIVIQAG